MPQKAYGQTPIIQKLLWIFFLKVSLFICRVVMCLKLKLNLMKKGVIELQLKMDCVSWSQLEFETVQWGFMNWIL